MKFIGLVVVATKTLLWRVLRRTRMEDKLRSQTLQEMRRMLATISAVQARPDNHRCIKYCYRHRNLIEDNDAVAQLESAYELITRRRVATFEDEVVIEAIMEKITLQIMNIDTQ